MTMLFVNLRIAAYIFVFALSATVLGIAINFAKLFLPHIQHDFTIYALVAPSLTMLTLLGLLQLSQPTVEVVAHTVMGILWLTMGAWSADVIGSTQCYSLGGINTPTNNGSMSARSYCYQMKVLEAFSWAIFIAFATFVIVVVQLTTRAILFGRHFAWSEHISQLGWFHECPGFPTEGRVFYPYYPYQFMGAHSGAYGGGYTGGPAVQQLPGHSVVIHQGPNGPAVTQVPGMPPHVV